MSRDINIGRFIWCTKVESDTVQGRRVWEIPPKDSLSPIWRFLEIQYVHLNQEKSALDFYLDFYFPVDGKRAFMAYVGNWFKVGWGFLWTLPVEMKWKGRSPVVLMASSSRRWKNQWVGRANQRGWWASISLWLVSHLLCLLSPPHQDFLLGI